MTESLRNRLQNITISTADDLAAFWCDLMGGGGFGRRTLWLGFIDEFGHPEPVLAPCDDFPREPSDSAVRNLCHVIQEGAQHGRVVLLISRPGVHAVQDGDRRWARVLAPLAPTWPVQLATADVHDRCHVRSIL